MYLIFLTLILCSCMKGEKVDLIFHNAAILCLDDSYSTGNAIAIKNGKIIEIGPERQILNKYRADEITDLQGKEITPNFTEGNLIIDSILNIKILKEIEIKQLERGITEVFVHNVSNDQLLKLLQYSSQMELIWHINLIPNKENVSFIRAKNTIKNQKIHIQGFTISNNSPEAILEACAIAKNQNLQIGLDFKKSKQFISIILKSLEDYKKDHRWFAFNLDDSEKNTFKLLEENNFFLLLNKNNKFNPSLFVFGSKSSKNGLYYELSVYSKLNNVDFVKILKSISNWSNYLTFSETKSGSLNIGKYANFTIFETSLSKSHDYNNVYSNATFIKGKKIYSME